jgi:chromosome segregation ATPase
MSLADPAPRAAPRNEPKPAGADLRGFAYPLEGVMRRQQWQLDRLRTHWANSQRATREARQRLARLDEQWDEARDAAATSWASRLDARLRATHIAYLARLQTQGQQLREEIDTLVRQQALARERCLQQQQRLSAVERHRNTALHAYVQDQSRLAAAEADRDWLSRRAARALADSRSPI